MRHAKRLNRWKHGLRPTDVIASLILNTASKLTPKNIGAKQRMGHNRLQVICFRFS